MTAASAVVAAGASVISTRLNIWHAIVFSCCAVLGGGNCVGVDCCDGLIRKMHRALLHTLCALRILSSGDAGVTVFGGLLPFSRVIDHRAGYAWKLLALETSMSRTDTTPPSYLFFVTRVARGVCA